MSQTPDIGISDHFTFRPRDRLDSWVDLGTATTTATASPISLSGAVTPTRRLFMSSNPFGGEHDYLRMLREAQRESNRSSSKVSPISSAFISVKTTPAGSPKSPPNTPNPELASSFHDELKAVYINHLVKPDDGEDGLTASDIMWDWSSRPNIPCNREWTFTSVRSRKSSSSSKLSSLNNSKESSPPNGKKKSYLTKEVFITVLLTNLVSFLVGAGIGIWLSKKGVSQDTLTLIEVCI